LKMRGQCKQGQCKSDCPTQAKEVSFGRSGVFDFDLVLVARACY
jgi:hypothetical protein